MSKAVVAAWDRLQRLAYDSFLSAVVRQALRQSLLKKYSRVRRDLDSLHNSRMSAYEKAECLESIRAQIQSAWRTDEIRRSKPSPQVLPPAWQANRPSAWSSAPCVTLQLQHCRPHQV